MQRTRDENRAEFGRKKRRSDNGEQMKIRNEKRKLKETPLISGNIRFYVNSEEEKTGVYNLVDSAKLLLNEKIANVSNFQILHEVFGFYLRHNARQDNLGNVHVDACNFQPYLVSKTKENCNENMFIMSESSLKNIVAGITDHDTKCREKLVVQNFDYFGHVCKVNLQCCADHTLRVDSSPRLPGGKFVSNLRMAHGLFSSGLRYAQYERFVNSARIGVLPESAIYELQDLYCDVTEEIAKESTRDALNEEVAETMLSSQFPEEYKGIAIITDARHAWRKNAKNSDIISIGCRTNKVNGYVVVSKSDEVCSQKHELFGVKKLYEHFTSNDVNIDVHGHDRNSSVNSYLKQDHGHVSNANDTWHATKGVAKELKKICSGPQYKHGSSWHGELSDKAGAIKTHCYYAIKNCQGSAEKLRENLDNIICHYQNFHSNCSPESRCKTDKNYVPSKTTITNKIALKLLEEAIHRLQIYKTPEDYTQCIDTHYVESFNNSCLIYHDKRIVFSDKEYKRRTAMSILDWNENINRGYTSVTFTEDAMNPRRQSGRKNLKPKTRSFCHAIWNKILDNIYT